MRTWLIEVDKYAQADTCKLLIGNKSDRTDRVVSEAEGQALARELNMPFLETSARTAENVEMAFIKMAEQLMKLKMSKVEEEDKATAFVTVHEGRRLGWKIYRGDHRHWFPDSRYYGLGDQRPPANEVTQQRKLFEDWADAERWCASFPAHPAEGGAPPRPRD